MERDYLAFGGNDRRRNPLLHHGLLSPVMREISDVEAIGRDERRRHPDFWNDFYVRYGLPHACVCPMWRQAGSGVGRQRCARTAKEGPIAEGERRVFRVLAGHWRNAAVLSRTFKSEGARILAGSLDALPVAAIVLDGFGVAVATTMAAEEEILRSGNLVRMRGGRIASAAPAESSALERAILRGIGNPAEFGRASGLLLRGLKRHRLRRHGHHRSRSVRASGPARIRIDAGGASRRRRRPVVERAPAEHRPRAQRLEEFRPCVRRSNPSTPKPACTAAPISWRSATAECAAPTKWKTREAIAWPPQHVSIARRCRRQAWRHSGYICTMCGVARASARTPFPHHARRLNTSCRKARGSGAPSAALRHCRP